MSGHNGLASVKDSSVMMFIRGDDLIAVHILLRIRLGITTNLWMSSEVIRLLDHAGRLMNDTWRVLVNVGSLLRRSDELSSSTRGWMLSCELHLSLQTHLQLIVFASQILDFSLKSEKSMGWLLAESDICWLWAERRCCSRRLFVHKFVVHSSQLFVFLDDRLVLLLESWVGLREVLFEFLATHV